MKRKIGEKENKKEAVNVSWIYQSFLDLTPAWAPSICEL